MPTKDNPNLKRRAQSILNKSSAVNVSQIASNGIQINHNRPVSPQILNSTN